MENNYTRIYDINTKESLFNRIKAKSADPAFLFLTIAMLLLVAYGIVSAASSLLSKIFIIPGILISLTCHEYAHAKMADFLGDSTPRVTGRLTLNPLKHLSFMGTFLLLLAGFGWAKPVEVNPNNCRNPKKAMVSIALAGPIANMLLAIFGVAVIKVLILMNIPMYPELVLILRSFVAINLGLMAFNLIPIPPLDGSRLLSYFLPDRYRFKYRMFEMYSPFILFFMIAIGGFNLYLSAVVNGTYSLLLRLFYII